jgi:glutathione S-transferase
LALSRFVHAFADTIGLGRLIVSDIVTILAPQDRDYFRKSRESRFGATLEEVTASRDETVAAFRAGLQPVRICLRDQPFLGGEAPLYADYILFGMLQWARCSSPFQILAQDDPLRDWFGRILDLFDGMGRHARHVGTWA